MFVAYENQQDNEAPLGATYMPLLRSFRAFCDPRYKHSAPLVLKPKACVPDSIGSIFRKNYGFFFGAGPDDLTGMMLWAFRIPRYSTAPVFSLCVSGATATNF